MTETKKITYIEAIAVFRPGLINTENSFKTRDLDIIKERNGIAVLDDDYFPTVQIDGRDTVARANLNKPSISFSVDCRVWGTSVTYRLYTDKKKKPETIRREIDKERDRKYGALFAVDLSFIR